MSEYEKILYTKQREAIRRFADELGFCVYRPNYHGRKGDCNTTLFYSPAAMAECAALDEKEKAGEYIPESKYPMYFWSLENTDANGHFSMEFANHGSIDLRGLDWESVLKAAMKEAWEKYNG